MSPQNRILYCNCAYAQVVPEDVKEGVLKKLCESGVSFDAVADLCEMSARQDNAMQRLAREGNVKIAACYPRAVKWLFGAADAPLPEDQAEVLNMRTLSADDVVEALFKEELSPNLPRSQGTGEQSQSGSSSGESTVSPDQTSPEV